MQVVTILRHLWRLRLFVFVIGLLAIGVFYLVTFRLGTLESRKYEVGVATVRILVDTPNSQVVDIAPKGSDTLGVRAGLLASLMVEGVVKDSIADRVGVNPSEIWSIGEAAPDPVTGPPSNPRGYALTTRVVANQAGAQLPIIEIEAQGKDVQQAVRLAHAAVTGLTDFLDSKAASENIVAGRRIRVSPLGSAQAQNVVRGPRLSLSLMATVMAFVFGCAGLLALSTLVSLWRSTGAEPPADGGSADGGPRELARPLAPAPPAPPPAAAVRHAQVSDMAGRDPAAVPRGGGTLNFGSRAS
jgi:hypothetical protein